MADHPLRLRRWCLGASLVLAMVVATGYGCSAGEKTSSPPSGSGGAAGTGGGSGGGGTDGGDLLDGSLIPVDGTGHAGAAASSSVDADCGTSDLAADPRQVNVLLVIDKSGSMSETPEGFGQDKWSALHGALDDALSAVQSHMWFGLIFYPYPAETDICELTPDASAIRVEVGEGAVSVPAILTTMGTTNPGGGTPTAAALQAAHEYFTSGGGADLPGDKVVVLATDGGPNCHPTLTCEAPDCTLNFDRTCCDAVPVAGCRDNCLNFCAYPEANPSWSSCLDTDRAIAGVQSLHDAGVRTYIIGIPGSELYEDILGQMALASGVTNPNAPPDYFVVGQSGGITELTSILNEITLELITSCEMRIEALPEEWDPGQVNVELDGVTVPQVAEDGWYLDADLDPPTVFLTGTVCDRVTTEGVASINVTFGCPTVLPE